MGRQKWGQHFLVNRGVVNKIIRLIPRALPACLEIGPGKGILTAELIRHLPGGEIVAVEIDPELGDRLQSDFGDAIRLIREDILKVSLPSLNENLPVFIMGNIPYYLSSDLLLWLAGQHHHISGGVLMIQKEFMEKILLQPPTPQTTLFRMFFQIRQHFDVSPGSFSPPPRVHSSVFRFDHIPQQALLQPIPVNEMDQFLRQCFSHRRKTLIKNLLPMGKRNDLNNIFETLDIPFQIRAERLSVNQFRELFFMIRKLPD